MNIMRLPSELVEIIISISCTLIVDDNILDGKLLINMSLINKFLYQLILEKMIYNKKYIIMVNYNKCLTNKYLLTNVNHYYIFFIIYHFF